MTEITIEERRMTQRREGGKPAPPAPQSERRVRERRQSEPTQPGYFISDIEEIRRRARSHIEDGAITPGYKADRETVIRILNEALATEIVCVLRYKRHYFMATGIHAQAVA